ncbi:MAG: hypothetical protein HY047_18165 [Acidobacteria bacterium]|nr:hypothetical protein [Acidobacteriota bacterium]
MKRVVATALLVLSTACSPTSAQQTKQPAPTDVVATVGSTSITLAEVDDKALQQSASSFGSMKLSQALYNARRSAIDEIVATMLMDQQAKLHEIDRATLIEQEITSQIAQVTEPEIVAWYQANQSRVQGASLDQVRAPIRAYLIQERMQIVRQQYVEKLKSMTRVRVMLEPPRITVKMASTSPTRGPANAPIEMIDFSDFQ